MILDSKIRKSQNTRLILTYRVSPG